MKEWVLAFFRDWAEAIAQAIVIIIALYIFLWPIKIQGTSMKNSVNDGDWVFGCRIAAWVSEPKHGEIVLFNVNGESGQIIKRVIGTSGDSVEISEGTVYLNGEALNENYATGETKGGHKTIVQNGYFYAMGDNREVSSDSRHFGQIPEKAIKSKILFRFYPLNNLKAYFLDTIE